MSNRVHVLINGEQFGPYPEVELRQHIEDRKILKSDLAWREGLADWISVDELLAQLDAARPGAKAKPPSPPRSAIDELREAARKGDADAQFHLSLTLSPAGTADLPGQASAAAVSATAEAEALRWLREAANARHPEAQYVLGFRLVNGRGVPRDDAEAARWF